MATHARHAAANASFDARRVERRTVAVRRASVRDHGEQAEAAALVDLSVYGCRLIAAPYAIGERLWLRFDGGWPIAAGVVWAERGELGCRFDKPIANALMRELTRR